MCFFVSEKYEKCNDDKISYGMVIRIAWEGLFHQTCGLERGDSVMSLSERCCAPRHSGADGQASRPLGSVDRPFTSDFLIKK